MLSWLQELGDVYWRSGFSLLGVSIRRGNIQGMLLERRPLYLRKVQLMSYGAEIQPGAAEKVTRKSRAKPAGL